MHWLFALQASPLAPSETHRLPWQLALASHCALVLHVVPQVGAVWVTWVLQNTSA
ncbi:MAG: hypothetical protein IPH72_25535 [Sandaracinaceae bacterium]|nr:hypothetical protein [Sandaracinaceae bacterium]